MIKKFYLCKRERPIGFNMYLKALYDRLEKFKNYKIKVKL